MITEDYVSFEIAKLLKEKGFDENTNYQYSVSGIHYGEIAEYNITDRSRNPERYISGPTLQMAMKWLREEKHYYIQINLDSWSLGSREGYYIIIHDINSAFEDMSPVETKNGSIFFNTYEEAVNAAIKYCLEKLI